MKQTDTCKVVSSLNTFNRVDDVVTRVQSFWQYLEIAVQYEFTKQRGTRKVVILHDRATGRSNAVGDNEIGLREMIFERSKNKYNDGNTILRSSLIFFLSCTFGQSDKISRCSYESFYRVTFPSLANYLKLLLDKEKRTNTNYFKGEIVSGFLCNRSKIVHQSYAFITIS